MMKTLYFLSILFVFLVLPGCEKEIDISEFRDEFGNYQPELKIEGLLQVDNPANSIVRIIKTSTITDDELYNGIDDDGDGAIDDFGEIINQVQDTSATVRVINLNSGHEFNFQFTDIADSTLHYEEDEENRFNTDPVYIPYGGYKPAAANFNLVPYDQYKIEIYSEQFNKTISGITTAYPAPEFIDTLYAFQDSTVRMSLWGYKEIYWRSDLDVSSYFITYEDMQLINENERVAELIYSRPAIRDNDLTEKYKTVSVGWDIIFGVGSPRVLRLTVQGLNPEYSQYIFSSLPLKDPQRTNLRDGDGNPVMGCFGAIAGKRIYIVLQ